MTGLTSSISIASNAMLLLGGGTLSSFTEGTSQSEIAGNLYESSYLSVLTNHRWRFATKRAVFSKLAGAPDGSEYTYKFQIPSDCIYLINTTTANYKVYGSEIYCNVSELEGDYLYRVNEDKLPPYFVKMLEFFLAAQFAIPLTGDEKKADIYTKLYQVELRKAKFSDSTQTPVVTLESTPYTDYRY